MKIDLHIETEVIEIDPTAREVTIVDKVSKELRIHYDSLVLATGADSFTVPIPGHTLPEVYGVRTLENGREILRKCKTAEAAVVIGARLVGLEMAIALKRRGLDVTVIERSPEILKGILDPELAEEIQEKLEDVGISFILGTGISEILGEDHVKAARAGPHEVKADMIVMAAGVRGRTELAQQMGVKLGVTKLIKVDERLETNIKGVYAAGDCIECLNAITDKPTISQLGSNAVRQGTVAGTNAAGGSIAYPPIVGACVSKLLDTEIASTGLTETQAKICGIDCLSASALVPARPLCCPERFHVRVKLVASKADGKLIGAQIISGKEAAPRIDTISVAILRGATVNDLILFDHAYSPLIAESTDPLSAVAQILSRRLRLGI